MRYRRRSLPRLPRLLFLIGFVYVVLVALRSFRKQKVFSFDEDPFFGDNISTLLTPQRKINHDGEVPWMPKDYTTSVPIIYSRPILRPEGNMPWRSRVGPVGHRIHDENDAPLSAQGPGENGQPVIPQNMSRDEAELRQKLYRRNFIDEYVSDMISLHRSLPDVRDSKCKTSTYPTEKMPHVSVIITFQDEAFSVVMRTVHSVIDLSPSSLLKEVILVDDCSEQISLGKQLEEYISHLRKVRLIRLKKREGTIGARLAGAKQATGSVIVFLESHCECTTGWLEPLVYRIFENDHNVVFPVIDDIDKTTFQFMPRKNPHTSVGVFDWNLSFTWFYIGNAKRKGYLDPVSNPTMSGIAFAISKTFFEHLGRYDDGMELSGAENIDLSFRIWLCGGRLEMIPCSHVGHVTHARERLAPEQRDALLKNKIRVARVWMDAYARHFFDRTLLDQKKLINISGDIEDRLALKKELNCHKFEFMVKSVWPQAFDPGKAFALGDIRSLAFDKSRCFDRIADKPNQQISAQLCHGQGGNQFWMYTNIGEIRTDAWCLDHSPKHDKGLVLRECHGHQGNQMFIYDHAKHTFLHKTTNKCVEMGEDKVAVVLRACNATQTRQHWTFQRIVIHKTKQPAVAQKGKNIKKK